MPPPAPTAALPGPPPPSVRPPAGWSPTAAPKLGDAPASSIPEAAAQPPAVSTLTIPRLPPVPADATRSAGSDAPASSDTPGRDADSRLARVHLRGALLPLARAALEQMAGAGTLDVPAMADLAEARWRGGDLEGAADAARAHLASGGAEPMAILIMAEDLMRTGHAAEARRYADHVYGLSAGAIDPLFAQEPRSPIWPSADPGWMASGSTAPGGLGLLVGGREVAELAPGTWTLEPLNQLAPADGAATTSDPASAPGPLSTSRGSTGAPASTTAMVISGRLAGQELDAIERALAAGDVRTASGRLAVLLRLDPALAPIVLSAAERAMATRPALAELPALHLIRGDAYRVLGRENEAAAAFRSAYQALAAGPRREESS